jgi:hypothetical protein
VIFWFDFFMAEGYAGDHSGFWLLLLIFKGRYMEQQKQKRENGGYLFKNADKRSEKQPDFRGKMNVAGKEWLVSGWTRTKDGEEMISISLTDPATLPAREGNPQGKAGAPAAAGSFARKPAATPSAAAAPAAAPAAKSFQPPTGKAGGSGYEDLDDLDSLFNGLDDQ